MSPVHAASLVNVSMHSQQLLSLLDIPIGRNLIDFLVQKTINVVSFAFDSSPPSDQSRGHFASRSRNHAAFAEFASDVVRRSEAPVGVLLVALVYIDRAMPHLLIEVEDYACERIFLGALMLAYKYTQDSTLKNVHWSLVTGVWGRRDVGRVEREFLEVIDWNLAVSESDLLVYHESIMDLFPTSHQSRHSFRLNLSSPHTKQYLDKDDDEEYEDYDSLVSASNEDDDDDNESLFPPTPPLSLHQISPFAQLSHLSLQLQILSLDHPHIWSGDSAPLPIRFPQILMRKDYH